MVEPGYPAPGRTAASEGGYGPSDALRQIRLASLALVAIALIGTAGYMLLLGWPFLDALYMTVISMITVGYKEVHDLSSDPVGQLWTVLILLTGVGTLFYAAASFVELVVEGTVRGYFVRRRVKAEIDKLSDHYVLCGYGRVGRQVAREFAADDTRFVVWWTSRRPAWKSACKKATWPCSATPRTTPCSGRRAYVGRGVSSPP